MIYFIRSALGVIQFLVGFAICVMALMIFTGGIAYAFTEDFIRGMLVAILVGFPFGALGFFLVVKEVDRHHRG